MKNTQLLAALLTVGIAPASADEISGTVLDVAGDPLAGAQVRLEIGRSRYALTEEYDRWHSVETLTATTDDRGRYHHAEIPEGAMVTVIARDEGGVGLVTGRGTVDVKLAPLGSVSGKVSAKRQDLKALRVWVAGGNGLGGVSGEIDKKSGAYVVEGLAPGEGRVHVRVHNFGVWRQPVVIEPGERAKVPTFKYRGKWLATSDPLVDCTQARLHGPDGKPLRGVQLSWSSRWMDGGMSSDEKGTVMLAGGGVAIGGPPYVLRLQSLASEHGSYRGTLRKVRRGVALIDLHPLRRVTGTVKRGPAAVGSYRLVAVGPGESPRVYAGRVADGVYTVSVPDGPCRFVIGTVDGGLHERKLDVQPGDGDLVHDLTL